MRVAGSLDPVQWLRNVFGELNSKGGMGINQLGWKEGAQRLKETAKQRQGDRKELGWCVSARKKGSMPGLEAEKAERRMWAGATSSILGYRGQSH